MTDELVQSISQKTGLSPDKAQEVVSVVLSHLKENTRTAASALDGHLSGNSTEGGSLFDRAKAMASGLGGVFEKKT